VATILSITDGHLLVNFGEVRKLFAWLVSDEDGDLSDAGAVFLHDRATEALLAEFPKLAEIEVPDDLNTDEKIFDWIQENNLDYILSVPQLLAGTEPPS
jgi:hypothetical protein